MAFTRKQITDIAKENNIELTKEALDSIIQLYTETRDTLISEAEEKAVEKYKAENPPQKEVKVEETEVYKNLQGEFDTYKKNVEGEKNNATKTEKVKAKLVENGVNEKALKLILKTVDLSKLELDGENLKGIDDVVTSLKTDYADFFGTENTKTTNTGNSTTKQANKVYTKEMLSAMTTKEINDNWSEIEKSLPKI